MGEKARGDQASIPESVRTVMPFARLLGLRLLAAICRSDPGRDARQGRPL